MSRSILILHYQLMGEWQRVALVSFKDGCHDIDEYRYAYELGDLPPRYPVPSPIGVVENDGYYVDILGVPQPDINLDNPPWPWKYANHETVTPALAWFIRNVR